MTNAPKCKKCGRPLRDPVSISIGLGPKCRGAASSGTAVQVPAQHNRHSPQAYAVAESITRREQALLADEPLTVGHDPLTKQPHVYKPDGQGNYTHDGSTITRENLINYMKRYGFIHSSIVTNQR